jgi:hypothetical protein
MANVHNVFIEEFYELEIVHRDVFNNSSLQKHRDCYLLDGLQTQCILSECLIKFRWIQNKR